MTDEIWTNIAGYDDYEISDRGRVKSLQRVVPVDGKQQRKLVPQRILKAYTRPHDGRQTVTLYNANGARSHTVTALMKQAGFRTPVRNHGDHRPSNKLLYNKRMHRTA